ASARGGSLQAINDRIATCGCWSAPASASSCNEELIANYEETIPPVFEDYTAAVTEGDSAKVCDELLSATGAEALEAESGEPCQLAVTHSTSPSTAGSEFELRELRPPARAGMRPCSPSTGRARVSSPSSRWTASGGNGVGQLPVRGTEADR
ncbi:MAG TPA: hypothetical protein VFT14_02490, partial [Solirubrobacterales bacterium]|nr:hypothetical protein [Solirubrobacterales bacterium]